MVDYYITGRFITSLVDYYITGCNTRTTTILNVTENEHFVLVADVTAGNKYTLHLTL